MPVLFPVALKVVSNVTLSRSSGVIASPRGTRLGLTT
jgi:hypothetical protein